MVILKGSVEISFAGSKEPAAYAEIVSMGGINSEVKKKLIATIGTILQSKLSIPRTRFFLKVYDTTVGRNYSKI
jgi:phenylpyruvate tautomerase